MRRTLAWKPSSFGLVVCILFCLISNLSAQITVDFIADNTEACTSTQSIFSDLSTSTEGAIVKWEWDLGGVTSEKKSPGRIFANIGNFDICLKVTDEKGNTNNLCKSAYIKVYDKPTVDFQVSNTSGCSPLEVRFMDLSSSPNGNISNWTWGIGGNSGIIETSDEGQEIWSTYINEDIYSASLTVVDDKGCLNSITKTDIIQVTSKPEIKISTNEPIGCAFPMNVDFVNSGDAFNTEYIWDFGNGETYVGYDPESISYLHEGEYNVSVIAKNLTSSCLDTLVLDNYINSGGTILFDFYPKVGCMNMEVQFEDKSPMDAETWEWDFGDGTNTNERDPQHVYKSPGKYKISLKRKTAECEGIQFSQYEVHVRDNPTIKYKIDHELSCVLPSDVEFQAFGHPDYNYIWYIGAPGNYEKIISSKKESHSFDSYGSREVRLAVADEFGCRSLKLIDTIEFKPFEARVTGETEGCIPFNAELRIESNFDVPLEEVHWTIVGQDTSYFSKEEIIYEVSDPRKYNVNVAVKNFLGCVDTINTKDLLKGGKVPDVDFAISDTLVCPQDLITFSDLTQGAADTWIWTFNDSTNVLMKNPKLAFKSPGFYDVRLEVGHNGCYASKSFDDLFQVNTPGVGYELVYNCDNPYEVKALNLSSNADSSVWEYTIDNEDFVIPFEDSILINFPSNQEYLLTIRSYNFENECENAFTDTVKVVDPVAALALSNDFGCAPLSVDIQNVSKDAYSCFYFSKNNVFKNPGLENQSILLRKSGEYKDMGLIITDIHGCQDTALIQPIRVNSLNAAFEDPDPVCINDTMRIDHNSTSLFTQITNFKWTLGNNINTSSKELVEFTFSETGKFDVSLKVEDDWGCVDSITSGLAAYFRAPNFELLADQISCTTYPIQFKNTLHSSNYNYKWNFGDGITSSEPSPIHLYELEGLFQVSLRIEDNESCVNEINDVVIIDIADPIARFQADSTFASCPPLITNFENNSSNSKSYSWNFGDDSGRSPETDPAHLFVKSGIFDVELIAKRTANCIDTLKIHEFIQLDGPKGEFNFEVDTSCVPLKVSFEAILAEEYSLTWDFGDGNLIAVEELTDSNYIEYSYLVPGVFIPKMIMEDNANCKISKEGETIETHDLNANFTTIDSIFCNQQPTTVDLFDLSESTSPIVNYSWNIEDQSLSGANPQYFFSDTGQYDIELIVTNAFCSDTLFKEKYINIGYEPSIEIIGDTFNCIGTETNIEASSLDINDELTWFNANGDIISSNNNVFNSLLVTSQFIYVEASNEFKCKEIDSLWVEVINDQTEFAGPDKIICYGSSTEIRVDYGQNINWNNSQSENCNSCESILVSPSETTIYPLEITNDYGCIVMDSLVIEVLSPEDIDAGDDQKVCVSERPLLLAHAPGDYNWYPSAVLEMPNSQLTAANISESTMFYLKSTKGECSLYDSVFVEIVDKANIVAMGDTVCFGEEVQLSADGLIDFISWESEEGDLSSSNVMDPTSRTTTTKDYMVIGKLGECIPDTAYAHVLVYPEIIGHLPEEKNFFKERDEVQLEVNMQSEGEFSYSWFPQEIVDCSSCKQVMVNVQDTFNRVSVLVEEVNSGCIDTFSVKLREYYGCESAQKGIGVPNIFSPNNDGYNDILNISSPEFGDLKEVAIFDRWGQRVFQSNTIYEGWDGTFKGQSVQSGVYTYYVKAVCPDNGKDVIKTGDVTVIK